MTAYLIAEAKVGDPIAYETYKALAEAAISRHGGRYLARGGQTLILEGRWSPPERLVIVEFDSLAQIEAFYDSPEYHAARAARRDAAEMNILAVAGLTL